MLAVAANLRFEAVTLKNGGRGIDAIARQLVLAGKPFVISTMQAESMNYWVHCGRAAPLCWMSSPCNCMTSSTTDVPLLLHFTKNSCALEYRGSCSVRDYLRPPRDVKFDGGGTDMRAGIDAANSAPTAPHVVIVLTDGGYAVVAPQSGVTEQAKSRSVGAVQIYFLSLVNVFLIRIDFDLSIPAR